MIWKVFSNLNDSVILSLCDSKQHMGLTSCALWAWMASSHSFLLLSSSSRRSSSKAFCEGEGALRHHAGTTRCQPYTRPGQQPPAEDQLQTGAAVDEHALP